MWAAVDADGEIDRHACTGGDVDRLRRRGRHRAPPADLMRPRRDVALPRRGADVDAVDRHSQDIATAGVHDHVTLGRLRRKSDVDDRLAVRSHVGAPRERREAGLRDMHAVRPDRDSDERRHRRRPDGLPVQLDVRARVRDAYREPPGLCRELLQPRVDEPLLAGPVLRAVRALSVVVRLVGLAQPAELVESVGDAKLGPPAGGGVEGRLIVGERPFPVLGPRGFVTRGNLVRGRGLGKRWRRCRRHGEREKERQRPRAMGSQAELGRY